MEDMYYHICDSLCQAKWQPIFDSVQSLHQQEVDALVRRDFAMTVAFLLFGLVCGYLLRWAQVHEAEKKKTKLREEIRAELDRDRRS